MSGSHAWIFTTGAAPGTTAPTVSSTSPAHNSTNVATNAAISATFSESMTASGLSSATFTLSDGATSVPAGVT